MRARIHSIAQQVWKGQWKVHSQLHSKSQAKKSFKRLQPCEQKGAGGEVQVAREKGGRSAKQKGSLTSLCWNPAELATGLGFLPATSRRQRMGLGKQKVHRLVGPRAALYILDFAAWIALCYSVSYRWMTGGLLGKSWPQQDTTDGNQPPKEKT